MKKLLLLSAFANTLFLAAAPYKSADEARTAIINTYEPLLKSSNMYTMKLTSANNQFGKNLHEFGKQLNDYILDKQGILMGRKSPKNAPYKPLSQSDNIFDIWAYLF